MQWVCLVLASDQEENLSSFNDHRPCQRYAPAFFLLRHMIRNRDPPQFVKRSCMRKQRRGMPVVAHSQRQYVESWSLRAFKAELSSDRALVASRCRIGLQLAFNAKDLLRLQRNLAEHRLARHAVVAVRMVRWNAAFINPVKLDLLPRHGLQERVCG